MSTERDAGLQALQQGNPAAAAPLLEAAIQQNPADFDALLFLGAAYGQIGRQMDAINTITKAVQVQPANAQARYNLAVAMEQGGYREQAVTALEQALTLQKEYPKAQDALNRLKGTPPPSSGPAPTESSGSTVAPASYAQPNVASGSGSGGFSQASGTQGSQYQAQTQTESAAVPQAGFGRVVENVPAPPPQTDYRAPLDYNSAPAAAPAGYAAQPPPNYGQPVYGAPPTQGAEQAYGAPPAQQTYSQPASGYNAPQPTPTAYGAPTPSPYAPPPTSPYAAPTPGPYGAATGGQFGAASVYTAPVRREAPDDAFDIAQAGKDWVAILTKPADFFQKMTGSTGLMSPLALALLYCAPIILSMLIRGATMGAAFKSMPGLGPVIGGGGVIVWLIVGLPMAALGMFLSAWILHLVGLLFGNKSPYSATFRALVYAYAPMPIIALLASFFPLNELYQQNPLSLLITFIGLIWFVVLLVMAISSEQELSTGPAIGVVVISGIVSIILAVGIGIALGIVIAIIIGAAAAGSHGMIPILW